MKLSTGFSVSILVENLKKMKPYIECQHIEQNQLVSISVLPSIIMMMKVIIAAANFC